MIIKKLYQLEKFVYKILGIQNSTNWAAILQNVKSNITDQWVQFVTHILKSYASNHNIADNLENAYNYTSQAVSVITAFAQIQNIQRIITYVLCIMKNYCDILAKLAILLTPVTILLIFKYT